MQICHLYNGIGVNANPAQPGADGLDLAITFADAGRAIRSAVSYSATMFGIVVYSTNSYAVIFKICDVI